jgi:uncharacterized protein (TIGR00730 family)
MKSLCVFCGSNAGTRPAYADAARRLGTLLAERNLTLVYGGSASGLMRVLADSVLAAGGAVIGVIPRALVDREVAHTGLTDLHVVGSMHERKQKMADLSDGFVVLPGGFGTLDETAEVLTWRQLGLHDKPCGLLDVADFFAPLLRFFDHAVDEGFVAVDQRRLLIVDDDPGRLIDRLVAASKESRD